MNSQLIRDEALFSSISPLSRAFSFVFFLRSLRSNEAKRCKYLFHRLFRCVHFVCQWVSHSDVRTTKWEKNAKWKCGRKTEEVKKIVFIQFMFHWPQQVINAYKSTFAFFIYYFIRRESTRKKKNTNVFAYIPLNLTFFFLSL